MLNFNWDILWTIINVIFLCVLVKIFLWKPVNKIIEKRQKEIADSLENVKKLESDAQKSKEEYEASIKNAKNEADTIIVKSREKAQQEYDKKLEAAQADSLKLITEAQRKIESEKNKAIVEAQAEIASVALTAAEKLLEKNIDKDSNSKLIESYLVKAGAKSE